MTSSWLDEGQGAGTVCGWSLGVWPEAAGCKTVSTSQQVTGFGDAAGVGAGLVLEALGQEMLWSTALKAPPLQAEGVEPNLPQGHPHREQGGSRRYRGSSCPPEVNLKGRGQTPRLTGEAAT